MYPLCCFGLCGCGQSIYKSLIGKQGGVNAVYVDNIRSLKKSLNIVKLYLRDRYVIAPP